VRRAIQLIEENYIENLNKVIFNPARSKILFFHRDVKIKHVFADSTKRIINIFYNITYLFSTD